MEPTSSTGPTTKAASFGGWSERDRRGFCLYLGWRDYWVKRQGYSGEFRRQDPEAVRADPQFEKYCKAAEWLTSRGRTVGYKLQGWRLYLTFVCDDLVAKRFRPSPAHLTNEWMLKRFNAGCSIQEEHRPLMGLCELARRYKRALHPALRSTACIRIMGFDQLHD
jgi:hypothetical protein